jgi:enoyl-CoA hydratase/carnithine racemase
MTLRLDIDGAVARVLLDRPERHNAMTLAMWQLVPEWVARAEAEPGVRVVVLTSARAGMFCAGADIGEMLAAREDAQLRAATQAAIHAAQVALVGCAKPTLAFVDGDAVGGGCGLALACDMRVASGRARFGITPARLGLVYPLHDTALLVDLVGPGQARRLMFSGMLIGAEEALRIGLIEEIGESADGLVGAMAANSAFSIAGIKQTIGRVLAGQREEDAQSSALFASAFVEEDFGARAQAFLQRKG